MIDDASYKPGLQTKQHVYAWCEDYESQIRQNLRPSLERQLLKVDPKARYTLLRYLLPIEVEDIGRRNGYLPLLRELTEAHPKLADAIQKLYPTLPIDLQVPEQLGRFTVVRMLSEGGQARVVRARDAHADDRLVAIKYGWTPEGIELLRRERNYLASTHHKNIVDVIDAGDHPPYFYMAMPYLRGSNLQSAYQQQPPSSLLAAKIVLQAARGVQHLHERRLMHGDIKPGNLHIDPEAPSDSLRLIDLGVAVDFDSWSLPQGRLMHVGGTREYMPPEQLIFDETCDGPRCDIYALGGVLYFLLTGQPPMSPEAAANGLRKVKASRQLKAIAGKALASKPADRFASVGELVSELEAYIRKCSLHSSLLKLSIPVAPAVGVALAGVTFGWFGGGDNAAPLPASEAALISGSEELGIDLSRLTAKDFRVSIVPVASSLGLQGLDFGFDNYVAKIVVEADDPISELMGDVEYRIGNRPWRNLHRELSLKGSVGDLTEKDVAAEGPVQLRIDSERGHGVGKILAGPFEYDIRLADILRDNQTKTIATIKSQWKEAKPPWIRRGFGGWELMVNGFQLPRSPVKEIRVGASPTELTEVAEVEISDRLPAGALGDPSFRDFFAEVQASFSKAASKFVSVNTLYAQLIFVDGSASDVIAFDDGTQAALRAQEELLRRSKPPIPSFPAHEDGGGDFLPRGFDSP